MNNFFNINSVAIVWASNNEWKIGNSLLKNLSTFSGEKYWVNPKWWEFDWIKFYKTITQLPVVVDILVFAIPSKFVLYSLIEAWKNWIKRVIIISAWSKEIGNIELENELIEVAKKYEIDLLWPNCLWYIDANKNLNLSFWGKQIKSCKWKSCNNIAMISQSGAMAVALSDWAYSKQIWFSKMISMWNKAWINENDLLLLLEKDNDTKVIALYLESIEFWEEFYNITKRISKKYPLILIKSWISEKWSKAASSHTWALSSEKEILFTAFENSWVHYTQSLENFFLWSEIFGETNLCDIPEELAIITNAGWPWVMATDHTENYWVKLTEFTDNEKDILKIWLSDSSSVANPIDIIWDATSKTYSQILNNLSKIVKKRAILIMLTAQSITDVENIANTIIDFKIANPEQFVMVTFMGWEWVEKWREILSNAGILEYDYPKKAIRAYSRLLIQKKWEDKKTEKVEKCILPKNISELKNKLKQENKFCSNALTWKILESFDINYSKEILVNSNEELQYVWDKFDSNLLVARISSPDIPHKSDVGWVILNIESKEKSIEAYNNILSNISKNEPQADIKWVTFANMLVKTELTREIFIWFKRDESFWNILIIWMWWIFVNIFEDVSRRIWIISKSEIKTMLTELKFFPVLEWVRGQKWINLDKLINIIFNLQFIFKEFTDISEIDINPIFSDENYSIVVDAKFYL